MAVGIPIRGLDVYIMRSDGKPIIGDFATMSVEPRDEAFSAISANQLWAYKLSIAGGLAGNRVAEVPAAAEGLQNDRQKLARVGPESLEQIADCAVEIIRDRSQFFDRIIALIRERLLCLMAECSLETGRHPLLAPIDLVNALGHLTTDPARKCQALAR